MSGLRTVELVEASADDEAPVYPAEHVIGVDESGTSAEEPLVSVAVHCPRPESERLAEALVACGLEPWKSKSSSRPRGISNTELSRRVRSLIDRLADLPVTWDGVAGWGSYDERQRGAIACIVAARALTGSGTERPGDDESTVLLHDGSPSIHGYDGRELRRYASRQFPGHDERIDPVYPAYLQYGDLTYPEIITADYLAGYVKSRVETVGIEQSPVSRIDGSWRSSNEVPRTLYELARRRRRRTDLTQRRIAQWIDGKQSPGGDAWGERPFQSIVERLESSLLREYLLTEL